MKTRLWIWIIAGTLAMPLVLASPAVVWAGAWTQAPGATFLKTSLLAQRAAHRWDCRGSRQPADPFGAYVSRQLFVYAEQGWTDRVTLLGSWAYKDQEIDGDSAYGTRSTGDLRLGGRVGLLPGPRPISLEGVLSIPTYPRSDLSAPVADREQFLPAGSGRVEAEIHLQSGFSFFPLPLYANLDLGYRERGGPFGDQWLAAAEIGGSSPRFFAKAEIRWALPEHGDCDVGAVGSVALQERSIQLSPEAAVRMTGSIWASVGYSHPLSGRNTLDAGQWSLGVLLWRPGS